MEKGEREGGRGGLGAGARNPGKANNSQQSSSVPEVPDLHHLPHTGLVILLRLSDRNSALRDWPTRKKGKYGKGSRNVCNTHLVRLDGGPGTLMI